ncbi:hypothetical protein [Micromonospora sp. NPDC092111]|uniref:hypothetical protein n=1 Tax=Micromonospora sp. NPDC092111 TaxID=3364289 RepID=UPI00380B1359
MPGVAGPPSAFRASAAVSVPTIGAASTPPASTPPGSMPPAAPAPQFRAAAPVSAPPVGATPPAPPYPGTPYRGGPDLASVAYGGGTDGPGHSTISLPTANPIENSGSLTGHILAQGWSDTPTTRSRTGRVVIVLAASLGLLVAISVLVVLLANDVLDGLVGDILTK